MKGYFKKYRLTDNREMHHILAIICMFTISSSELIVETNSGSIRSVTALSDDVEAFLGVPYAEPPIGELRFAKPVPKKPWRGIYNASSLPPPCTQIFVGPHYSMPDITNMSEDCLYLNIWMPKAEPTIGFRPIIIYIHPGAFATGSSNMTVHDGSHFASRGDVVVVTINYRLGTFGYFLAYTEEANGNMGIYDQIQAMRWVKDNAKYFSGDPENIVLMGVSAGAFSVSAHMISPLSKNLFNKAIMHSGSIVHPYLMDDNAMLFRNSQFLASMVGCTNDTFTLETHPRSVVKCLKGKKKEDLVAAETALFKANPMRFLPRVNDEFLPKGIISLLREGKFRKDIDVMMGITKDEGSLFLTLGLPEYFGLYGKNSAQSLNKHTAASFSRAFVSVTGQFRPSEIVDFYTRTVKNKTSTEYMKMLANVMGDFFVACGTVFLADFISLKGNRVYFYKFDYRSSSTPAAEWIGTTHLDELQYVFGNPYHENFTTEEVEMSHNLIDRWSGFAKAGNPNIPGHVPWLRYSYHNSLYLNFDQEESIRLKPLERCDIWRKRFNTDFDADLIRHLRISGMQPVNTSVS